MMLAALLLLQAAPAVAPHASDRCAELSLSDPAAALAEAERWRIAGGGVPALRCAGLAEAQQGHWAEAAGRFEAAAHDAELTHDALLADLWAQAGNAWLAAGNPGRARTALGTALTVGTLAGQPLGEAQLDQARALVAGGDLAAARTEIDLALAHAPADPLAWLLSATLARRQEDLRRARIDIAEALRRSPDDPSVQLETGNIAALGGDEAGARAAWQETVRLRPNSDQARAALAALRQFDAPAPPTAKATAASR